MANTQASGLDDRRPHAGEAESFFRVLEESGHLPPGVGAPEAGMAALALLSLSLRGSMARRFVAALPETLRALVGPVLDGRDPAPVVSGRDQQGVPRNPARGGTPASGRPTWSTASSKAHRRRQPGLYL